MTEPDTLNPALLPVGLRDLLPPDAETEAAAVERLMDVFAAHGYQRVKPPLIEFEQTLLAGSGAAVAEQTFRLLDPDSQRVMGLRADTTPQVARIATTRLSAAPRPLRLSYAGQCLRVRGVGFAPDRQMAQAGVELIGPDSPAADAEVVLVAAEALEAVGLDAFSVDLTMPTFVPALLDDAGITGARRLALARDLDRKDAAAVAADGGALAGLLSRLLPAAGSAARALKALAELPLPAAARPLAERLAETVGAIQRRRPDLRLTVDPVEFRGFRYEVGVSATIYAIDRPEELGRGGRYLCGDTEAATGLTLYPDAVLRAAPARVARPRVFLPPGTPDPVAVDLRRGGYATVAALDDAGAGGPEAAVAEARRLACTHVLRDGAPVALGAV